MRDIDPTELERWEWLVVSDTDSPYDGTKGQALRIYDYKVTVQLDVWTGDGVKLVRDFDLDQLARVE